MTTKQRYHHELEEVIAKAKVWREVVIVTANDGAEIYAYARPEGRIAWGVNAAQTGANILRGVRRPDGTNEAVRIGAKISESVCF